MGDRIAPKMKSFANWSVRSKLLIPVISIIVIGGLIAIMTFTQLTQVIRGESLQHVARIAALRAAALDLVGEYREYMVENAPDVLEEIKQGKEEVETTLRWLFQHSEHFRNSSTDSWTSVQAISQSLYESGDDAVAIQGQIITALENMDELEAEATKIIRSALTSVETEAHKARQNNNWEFLASTSLLELANLINVELVVLRVLSETREFILSGKEETIEELRVAYATLGPFLAAFPARTEQFPNKRSFITLIEPPIQKLVEISKVLLGMAAQRAETLEEIEKVAEQLQDTLEEINITESRQLDALFDRQYTVILSTITLVLALVILTLVVSTRLSSGRWVTCVKPQSGSAKAILMRGQKFLAPMSWGTWPPTSMIWLIACKQISGHVKMPKTN